MKKLTLRFKSLSNLTRFSRELNSGYLINTGNLTLTGKISEPEINMASQLFDAEVIATTEKVYSYDLLTDE